MLKQNKDYSVLDNYEKQGIIIQSKKNKNYLKAILYTIYAILYIDFIGYIFWSISGQVPLDSFYIGIVSNSIINLIK